MGIWGEGLMQSDDDCEIASDLCEMTGLELLSIDEKTREIAREKLNGGLLAQKFDKILSPTFQPRTSHHQRGRVAIILGMLAMGLGATIEGRHLAALNVLRRWLPTMEQQLQLVTALDEYKNNGTCWIMGSKSEDEAAASKNARRKNRKNKFDLGDEFWFSGLG